MAAASGDDVPTQLAALLGRATVRKACSAGSLNHLFGQRPIVPWLPFEGYGSMLPWVHECVTLMVCVGASACMCMCTCVCVCMCMCVRACASVRLGSVFVCVFLWYHEHR